MKAKPEENKKNGFCHILFFSFGCFIALSSTMRTTCFSARLTHLDHFWNWQTETSAKNTHKRNLLPIFVMLFLIVLLLRRHRRRRLRHLSIFISSTECPREHTPLAICIRFVRNDIFDLNTGTGNAFLRTVAHSVAAVDKIGDRCCGLFRLLITSFVGRYSPFIDFLDLWFVRVLSFDSTIALNPL